MLPGTRKLDDLGLPIGDKTLDFNVMQYRAIMAANNIGGENFISKNRGDLGMRRRVPLVTNQRDKKEQDEIELHKRKVFLTMRGEIIAQKRREWTEAAFVTYHMRTRATRYIKIQKMVQIIKVLRANIDHEIEKRLEW